MSDCLTVENFVGRGYWKDVYKAKQHSTQQFVALKHLREKSDRECASLIREVRTQAALTHQNIPPVFALDILPTGQAIVVEKLVDGSRWSDTIQSRTIEDNLRILLEVANAVAFAHQQHKIIHRDLKPDNVVVNDKYGEVYVVRLMQSRQDQWRDDTLLIMFEREPWSFDRPSYLRGKLMKRVTSSAKELPGQRRKQTRLLSRGSPSR